MTSDGNGTRPNALLLFDIDGTILRGYGSTVRAMERAARAVLTPNFSFAGIDMAGRLDPAIFATASERNGLSPTEEQVVAFRDRYFEELAEEAGGNHLLPGIHELVAGLEKVPDYVLGLLTGNFATSARIKVRSVGLDPSRFPVGAFGGDAPTRSGLVPIAMHRARLWFPHGLSPRRVLIIGDTPLDVQCARDNGCPCLGVGTGNFSSQALRDAGADAALDDLGETGRVMETIAKLLDRDA